MHGHAWLLTPRHHADPDAAGKRGERCTNFCRLFTDIIDVQETAAGAGINDHGWLNERYGSARWRKPKGRATTETFDASIRLDEVHCHEAHGMGKRPIKRNRFLD